MYADIEISWTETEEVSGVESVEVIQEGTEVYELEGRYSVNYTDRPIDMAWKWINEMYNIPNPKSVKNFELKIKFK